MDSTACFDFRPPQFSEEFNWLPDWIQQNQSQRPGGEEESERPLEVVPLSTRIVDGGNLVDLRENDEARCADFQLFLSGEDSSPTNFSPDPARVNHFYLRLSFTSSSQRSESQSTDMSPFRSPSANANGTVGGSNSIRRAAATLSTAMTTAKWLQTVVSPLPPEPSAELKKFLPSCDKDGTDDVIRRVCVILEVIFPNTVVSERSSTGDLQSANLMDNIWAEQRRLEVIESFVRHEESLPKELRRHLNTLEERLLERMAWEKGSSMYNSLIVAKPVLAAEINRLSLLAEPMPSLDAISMHTSYSSGGLPQSALQKHDTSGQNGDIRSPKRTCVNYRSGLVDRNSFTSPVKDRLLAFSCIKSKLPSPPLQSAFASPTRPHSGGGGETCAETGINILFTKITKLAAARISGMLERLQLSQQMKESVYSLFQQILNQRTSLFFNRHIDQIILCCFYGVAKVCQTSLTFMEIINNYRKQPHFKPQVFRNVFVDWSSAPWSGKSRQDHVDIITFYNEMFIPSVKPLLVELSPGESSRSNGVTEVGSKNDAQCPESPKISAFLNLPDVSPRKFPLHITSTYLP